MLQISPVDVVVDIVLPTLISHVSHTTNLSRPHRVTILLKNNVVLLVLMIFYGSPIGRACIVFLGLSTSVGIPGTVADTPTGHTVDALISVRFPFSLAPHTVRRCL